MEAGLTAPGLYLRGLETPPAPPLESGVTGFVGIAERGPLNSPQPVIGWSEYVDTFGELVSFGFLAESVFGFFRNGGEKCWVVRVADTSRVGVTPLPGQCPLVEPLAAAEATLADHTGDPSVRIVAIDPGGWGNRMQVRLATSAATPIRVGVLTQPTTTTDEEVFIDSIIDLRPGGVIRITELDGVSGARDFSIQSAASALDPALGRVELTSPVGKAFPLGSVVFSAGFRIEAEFRGRREIFDRLSMQSAHERYFVNLINGREPVSDYGERRRRRISTLIHVDHLSSGGGDSRFRPADAPPRMLEGGGDGFTQATATFLDTTSNPLLTIVAKSDRGSAGNSLQVIARPFAAKTALPIPDATGNRDRIIVDEIGGFQAGEEIRLGDLASPPLETATPSLINPDERRLQLPADLAQSHAVGETVAVADRFTLAVQRPGDREPREVVRNLSGDAAAGSRFVRNALAAESDLLCADTPPASFATPLPSPNAETMVALAGGSDPGEMDPWYYTGYESNGAYFHPAELPPGTLVGLATLERIDEVSLVAAPDVVRLPGTAMVEAQRMVLHHCAEMGDRFALLDSPHPSAGLIPEDWVVSLAGAELRSFGSAFYPWVRSTFEGEHRITPPSGFVAGVFARSDAESGVGKAPANERLEGAFGLEPSIDRRRHGELNPLGINCVVKLEEGEVRLMGSRTLSESDASRYVSVRRTILSVKKALSRRMLWTVFEPAEAALCRRIESTLTTYLAGLLAKGVTASQRPSEAFYVKCDEETNPADQLRNGTVVAEVGIALLAPAEFIVLTARRTPQAVQVIEEEI